MNNLVIKTSKKEILNSLQLVFSEYKEKRKKIEEISGFVKNKSEVLGYFLTGNKVNGTYANSIFDSAGAIKSLDSEYWNLVVNMTDVLSCMTATKRNEFNEQIRNMTTPPFEEESVLSTIYSLLQNRDQFFADKVDGVFQKLSRNHVTNSPMGFKQRMIIDYFLTSYGSLNHDRVEYLTDLRDIISKIMKREGSKIGMYSYIQDIISSENFGQWFSFDGGAFRIRIYKKGTAHIEIAEELAIELNSILSQKYPLAIPEQNRSKKKNKNKEFDLQSKLLSFNACNVISDIADSVFKGNSFSLKHRDLSSDVETEVLDVLNYLNVNFDNAFYFNYDASIVLKEISRMGSYPDKKSYQFYPTSDYLSLRMVKDLHIERYDQLLEPSAGMGGIANHLPKKQTTCVEISPVHCSHLRSLGFKEVIEMDFLKYKGSLFDKIVMNPPFTKNQAKDHLIHAISLLKEDGVLKAILPSSYIGKVFCEKRKHSYSEPILGEFDGTNVSVTILNLENNNLT